MLIYSHIHARSHGYCLPILTIASHGDGSDCRNLEIIIVLSQHLHPNIVSDVPSCIGLLQVACKFMNLRPRGSRKWCGGERAFSTFNSELSDARATYSQLFVNHYSLKTDSCDASGYGMPVELPLSAEPKPPPFSQVVGDSWAITA